MDSRTIVVRLICMPQLSDPVSYLNNVSCFDPPPPIFITIYPWTQRADRAGSQTKMAVAGKWDASATTKTDCERITGGDADLQSNRKEPTGTQHSQHGTCEITYGHHHPPKSPNCVNVHWFPWILMSMESNYPKAPRRRISTCSYCHVCHLTRPWSQRRREINKEDRMSVFAANWKEGHPWCRRGEERQLESRWKS